MMRVILGVPLALVALAAWPAPAHADPRADNEPWAVGVSAQNKATAQARLEQGNALYLARKYKEAFDQYEMALKAWDHPAIRFNVVRCLIQLDRPVEAAENLEATLKYGAAPLEEAVYTEALSYQKLFANQTGDLEVSCSQNGATVSLDGVPLIAACPSKQTRRVKPGSHQLVGIKPGFLTATMEVKVVGGEHDAVDVKLVPLDKAAKLTRRWATWKPWVVFGSGLAVVGFGGVVELIAASNMNAYDRQVALQCGMKGCNPADPNSAKVDDSQRSSAVLENRFAIGMMSVGAAAVLTGGVLLYMNRTYTVYEKPAVDVTPTAGGATVSLRTSF